MTSPTGSVYGGHKNASKAAYIFKRGCPPFTAGKIAMRAVSYLLAVVLVAVITIALGVTLYAYYNGWIGSKTAAATGPEGVLVVESGYLDNSTGSPEFVLFVRNDGKAPVKIERAYITAPNGTVVPVASITVTDLSGNTNITTLNPGSVAKVAVGTTGLIINPDEVYTIKVVAHDGSEAVTTIRT
jgi:hypothetical protein